MELQEIKEILKEKYPEKTIVDITENEAADKKTYKEKYETIKKEIEKKEENDFIQNLEKENLEKENSELRKENETLKKEIEKLTNETAEEFRKLTKKILEEEIIISNPRAYNLDDEEIITQSDRPKRIDPADKPGVYQFKRPSYFTQLRREMNKANEGEKVAKNTKEQLIQNLLFWKKQSQKEQVSKEEIAEEYDERRSKALQQLMKEELSNEERYLKYILLSPGLGREYYKTLNGASELGLDARVIISLLEQPKESFNKELIEAYVSAAHKGTEYNLRKELAKELVEEDWYIVADINGKPQRYQLVPIEFLKQLEENLRRMEENLTLGKKEPEVKKEPEQLEKKEEKKSTTPSATQSSSITIEMPDDDEIPGLGGYREQ